MEEGFFMYICLCFGVTESMVKNLVDEGAGSVKEVQRGCQAGKDCGTCLKALKKAVQKECGK